MLFGISLAMGPGSPTCRGTSWSSASLPMGGPRSVNRSSIGTVLRAADRFGSWFRTSARRRDFQTAFRTRRRGHLQCGVVTGNSAPARQISVRSHCDAMAECGLAPSEPDVPCAHPVGLSWHSNRRHSRKTWGFTRGGSSAQDRSQADEDVGAAVVGHRSDRVPGGRGRTRARPACLGAWVGNGLLGSTAQRSGSEALMC